MRTAARRSFIHAGGWSRDAYELAAACVGPGAGVGAFPLSGHGCWNVREPGTP